MAKKSRRIQLSLNPKTVSWLRSQDVNISGLVDDLLFWWIYFQSKDKEPEMTAEQLQKDIARLVKNEKIIDKMVNKIAVLHAALQRAERKIDELDIYLRT